MILDAPFLGKSGRGADRARPVGRSRGSRRCYHSAAHRLCLRHRCSTRTGNWYLLICSSCKSLAVDVLRITAQKHYSIDLTISDLISQNCVLFWKTGVCGGFTTFSTFSLEAYQLFERRAYLSGGLYVLMSVCLCYLGILCGKRLVLMVR